MKITVNIHTFREEFNRMGRGNQFTYEGLEMLFDYLTDLEHCEEEYELDVIELCCDFAEGTAQEIAQDYNFDLPDIFGVGEEDAIRAISEAVRDDLDNEGVLIGETDTTFVYRQF